MEGTPVMDLLWIAATAVQLADARLAPPVPLNNGHGDEQAPVHSSGAMAEELVHDALSASLRTALEGLADEGTAEDAASAHVDALQGVVRALDATDMRTVAEGDVPPAAAASADSEAADQAVSQYRQEVWDALQGLTTGPASNPAAVAARVHVLDLLSAIARVPGPAGPSRWGDWRPPAGAAGSGTNAQHSLLLSCTLALVEPLWPAPVGEVSAADLADVVAATALFMRLLDAAESPQQLAALAELLEDTWRHGAELAPTAVGVDKPEHGGSAPGANPDATSGAAAANAVFESGQRGCWVPAAAEGSDQADEQELCTLHACWAALLGAMVRRGQVAAVVKLVDAHAEQKRWLAAAEAHRLAAITYSNAGKLSCASGIFAAFQRGKALQAVTWV